MEPKLCLVTTGMAALFGEQNGEEQANGKEEQGQGDTRTGEFISESGAL